ncbi:MAG: P-loop ATPase, Sll1717 family [Chloroflexota bacterium]
MLTGQYLRLLNFTEHPFGKHAAEKEELLQRYFVQPRYFSEALGEARHPKSYVVFGPRGGGKSAIRSMIQTYCNDPRAANDIGGEVLSITYDDFSALNLRQLGSITLGDHVNEILKRGVPKLVVSLVDQGKVGDELPTDVLGLLRWYIDEYMSDLSRLEIDEIMRSLRTRAETAKRLLGDATKVYNTVISVLKLEKIEPTQPVDTPRARRDANSSMHVLEVFVRLAVQVGYTAVYVLVDRVDETDETGGDSSKAARLVHTLITNIRLLEIDSCAFKLFLWDKVRSHFGEDLRQDRIAMKQTEWTDVDLKRMLELRIKAYSSDRTAVVDLFEPVLRPTITDALIYLGHKSPRDVNRLMEAIIAEVLPGATEENPYITLDILHEGITKFAQQRSKELYGEELLGRLQRLNRIEFTIADVAATFRIAGGQQLDEMTATNRARNLVRAWISSGVIQQTESVMRKVNGRNRPVNQYVIVDPRVSFLVDSDRFYTTFNLGQAAED